MGKDTVFSTVERAFIAESGRRDSYESERIPTIEVVNVGALGKLACLRFLEWVQAHPQGVVALPTGRTPEMFIACMKHYKATWGAEATQAELSAYGLNGCQFPDTTNLRFVQLDEFYPMSPQHKNSFTHYVRSLYFPLLGLQDHNILDMDLYKAQVLTDDDLKVFPSGKADLTLLERAPFNDNEVAQQALLQRVQAFCAAYEAKVRAWGGVGFFLGGIGPDGHIAFNMQDSQHDSVTRLVSLNYMTAAAASGDLGGIEHARDKAALTLGLGTITFNKDATVIIMAAGEGKGKVVAAAIEQEPSPERPASVLQQCPHARFYLSRGAASLLDQRKTETLDHKVSGGVLSDADVDEVVVDLCLALHKRILDLTPQDMLDNPRASRLLRLGVALPELLRGAYERLVDKVTRGVELCRGKRVLHTAPHHDDIMLSYHAALPGLMETNEHEFTYVTSGFHAVTNHYMLDTLTRTTAPHFLQQQQHLIFHTPYPEVISAFVTAHKVDKDRKRELELESVLCLRNLSAIWNIDNMDALQSQVSWLIDFFSNQLPGDKSPDKVQVLKGSMRETEADRMWALRGVHPSKVSHLRSAFYTDDFFTPLPTIDDDALPFIKIAQRFRPDIVTVAFDPEGTGPDTHYKVLQVVAQSIRMQDDLNPVVWGYRNVWFRFHPSETTVMAPVDDAGLEEMNDAFLTCFSTQKAASFPAPDHDGPFSEWSELSQRAQRGMLGVLLGETFFDNHPDPRVRGSTGYVFIKEMSKDVFGTTAASLKGRIEV